MIILKTVNDFKYLVGASDFSVTFRKANGQFRKAERANCAEVKTLVKGNGSEQAAETRQDKNIVVYFDHDAGGVRSFVLDTIIKLIVNGVEYNFGF